MLPQIPSERIGPSKSSYILRLERRGTQVRICLHDLKQGQQWEFLSWEELLQHLEQPLPPKLH